MSKPKTNPYKVGDRATIFDVEGTKRKITITKVLDQEFGLLLIKYDAEFFDEQQIHYSLIYRRLVKRKKKCERCETLAVEEAEWLKINNDLKAKLAKYESAEKYWVAVDPPKGVIRCFRTAYFSNAPYKTSREEMWQVAVIDKKKAGEE